MARHITLALPVLVWTIILCPKTSLAQQQQGESGRKVVNRIAPVYPALARTMDLKGLVRVQALVATTGTVKSVEVKGGNPVLAQAAVGAIRKWKWEPASHETTEPVEVRFNPE